MTRAPETRGVAHRPGSFTNLDHRLGFQGLAGDNCVDSGGLWGAGRVEGQPSCDWAEVGSPGSGTKWIKRIRRFRRLFEAGRRTDTRRARASATLRPKLMEAADMERAAMVSRLRTTAALKRIRRRLWTRRFFNPRDVAFGSAPVEKNPDRMVSVRQK